MYSYTELQDAVEGNVVGLGGNEFVSKTVISFTSAVFIGSWRLLRVLVAHI